MGKRSTPATENSSNTQVPDALEDEAWTRAVDGRSRPIFQGGVCVGYVQIYSDSLLITLLKAHRPEKYRENMKIVIPVRGIDTDEEIVAAARLAIPVLQRVMAGDVSGSNPSRETALDHQPVDQFRGRFAPTTGR